MIATPSESMGDVDRIRIQAAIVVLESMADIDLTTTAQVVIVAASKSTDEIMMLDIFSVICRLWEMMADLTDLLLIPLTMLIEMCCLETMELKMANLGV